MYARIVGLILALTLMGATPATTTPAAGTAADRAASFKFLLGTWHCTRTISVAGTAKAATMTETQVVTAHGPQWLHAAQTIMRNGQTGSQQDLYLAYNAQHANWVLVTIDSRGASQVETSTSPSLNGSNWVVAYPSTSNGKSLFKKTSDNGYSSSSSWTSSSGGKMMTSAEACTRQ